MKKEIIYRDQTVYVSGCKHVYLCCKVLTVCGHSLTVASTGLRGTAGFGTLAFAQNQRDDFSVSR